MVLLFKKAPETKYFSVSPEPGNLIAEGIGGLPDFISAQNGGLGEYSAASFAGMKKALGKNAFLMVPNWKRQFKENWKRHYEQVTGKTISDDEVDYRWSQIRMHETNHNGLILLDSKWFEDQPRIYGNTGFAGESLDIKLAVEFQEVARNIMKQYLHQNHGRNIFDFQDQKTGPLLAYLKTRDAKAAVIGGVHNGHSDRVDVNMYNSMNVQRIRPNLFFADGPNGSVIETMPTMIKNADGLKIVGDEFKRRSVNGDFRGLFGDAYTDELRIKDAEGKVFVVPNGVSPTKFSENTKGLSQPYSPATPIVPAQLRNRQQVFRELGFRPNGDDAKFAFSTSRLTDQKLTSMYPVVFPSLLEEYNDLYVVVAGDPDGSAESLRTQFELESLSHKYPNFSYIPFKGNDALVRRFFSTGGLSFGLSFYEPFGFTDVDNQVNGALAVFPAVDGFKDKTVPLGVDKLRGLAATVAAYASTDLNRLKRAPQVIAELRSAGKFGNGVLFEHPDVGGLAWGLREGYRVLDYLQSNPDVHEGLSRLVMLDAREKYSIDNMVRKTLEVKDFVEKACVDNGWWESSVDKGFNPYA